MAELLKYLGANVETANALSSIANTVVAACALFVSMVSLYVATATLRHQRRHNILSVTPIPEVTVADFENSLRVKIRNHGSGPLLIRQVEVSDGSQTLESVIGWMPDLPAGLFWATYAENLKGTSLLPGKEVALIQLDGDDEDPTFVRLRDDCRAALQNLSVTVEFSDVYGTRMEPLMKKLDWFGRHLA